MTDLHYGLTVRPKRLREAVGPLAACAQRGETVQTTHLLAEVTCERCRNMVESAGVAVWEIEAEKVEASYRREICMLRAVLVLKIVRVVLPAVAVVVLLAVIWQEVSA